MPIGVLTEPLFLRHKTRFVTTTSVIINDFCCIIFRGNYGIICVVYNNNTPSLELGPNRVVFRVTVYLFDMRGHATRQYTRYHTGNKMSATRHLKVENISYRQ